MVYESAGSEKESVQFVVRIQALYSVKDTADDIMAARSLSAGKDDSDIHLGIDIVLFSLTGYELYQRKSIGIGKQLLYLFLVTYTLGSFSCLQIYYPLKTFG